MDPYWENVRAPKYVDFNNLAAEDNPEADLFFNVDTEIRDLLAFENEDDLLVGPDGAMGEELRDVGENLSRDEMEADIAAMEDEPMEDTLESIENLEDTDAVHPTYPEPMEDRLESIENLEDTDAVHPSIPSPHFLSYPEPMEDGRMTATFGPTFDLVGRNVPIGELIQIEGSRTLSEVEEDLQKQKGDNEAIQSQLIKEKEKTAKLKSEVDEFKYDLSDIFDVSDVTDVTGVTDVTDVSDVSDVNLLIGST